jgi:uncharacterized membrane protein
MHRQRLERKMKQRMMRMGQMPSPFRRLRNPRLAPIVERNINTILELRQEVERSRSFQERVADAITAWSGSMLFVYVHVLWFGAWIVINLHLTRVPAFDPYPFGLLTMIVSLEAIFLATFVLISQNRQATVDAQRNDLDLQVDLLAEYEVTRVLALVDAIADHLGLDVSKDPELDDLKQHTTPEALVQEMQQRQAAEKQRQDEQRRQKEWPPNGQPANGKAGTDGRHSSAR